MVVAGKTRAAHRVVVEEAGTLFTGLQAGQWPFLIFCVVHGCWNDFLSVKYIYIDILVRMLASHDKTCTISFIADFTYFI